MEADHITRDREQNGEGTQDHTESFGYVSRGVLPPTSPQGLQLNLVFWMIWYEQSICHVRMLQQSCGENSHQQLVPTGQARKCVTFKANPSVSAKDSEIASCVTSNSINNSLARAIHSNWPRIVWKIYFIFDYVYVDWDYSTMVGCKGSTKNVSLCMFVYVIIGAYGT